MEKLVEDLWKELQGLDKENQLAKLEEFAQDVYSDGFSDGWNDQDAEEDESDDDDEELDKGDTH